MNKNFLKKINGRLKDPLTGLKETISESEAGDYGKHIVCTS